MKNTTQIVWTYRVIKEDDEWVVLVRKNGVRYEPACYYAGDDKEDATNTMADMKSQTDGSERSVEELLEESLDDLLGTGEPYPDSKDGVIDFLRIEFDIDATCATFTPDPVVAGVWKVSNLKEADRLFGEGDCCIAYLAGFKDVWGRIRIENDAEFGTEPGGTQSSSRTPSS